MCQGFLSIQQNGIGQRKQSGSACMTYFKLNMVLGIVSGQSDLGRQWNKYKWTVPQPSMTISEHSSSVYCLCTPPLQMEELSSGKLPGAELPHASNSMCYRHLQVDTIASAPHSSICRTVKAVKLYKYFTQQKAFWCVVFSPQQASPHNLLFYNQT